MKPSYTWLDNSTEPFVESFYKIINQPLCLKPKNTLKIHHAAALCASCSFTTPMVWIVIHEEVQEIREAQSHAQLNQFSVGVFQSESFMVEKG